MASTAAWKNSAGARIHLADRDGHTALVVQEDFSCHRVPAGGGSDFDRDPAEIQQYMAFRDVLRIIQRRDQEERGARRNSGQATASLGIHPGKAEDP